MPTATLKCRQCKERFKRETMIIAPNGAAFCCDDHRVKYALESAPKTRAKMVKRERKESRAERREFLYQHKPHQLELTRVECNRLARMLDHGKLCISCGEIAVLEAGHFRSVASCPELRFVLLNIHGQCRACNQAGTRKMNRGKKPALVAREYEIRLRDRIGDEAVDWLQGPHPMPHYSCDDLREMRAMFIAEQKYVKEHGTPSRDWRSYPPKELAA